ncbi:bifunctional adenosylcobinamide kinase/adenosylcobinamide-phosphate guanylyltransferase [Lachnotalea glycerini]|uniref:Uncharacterized protein n=1 Tax=Lachnotalea glycerini TaxID=1763509 RepID=A0A371JK92_9FIRM|nr:bifunctional adenosylcobinamide kinase/adenosylcobinamide-phosphate guanylyltransferase [Lachnotalea glycerini]RDY33130.1 hypothetical protein CG710_000975 [Lachnotalea glycerini]
MIFVTGGAFQGKTEFVKEHFNIQEQEIVDGCLCEYHKIYHARVINHFEGLLLRLLKENKSVSKVIEDLLWENKNAIIISTEIGCGLVPVDTFEREYRETVGRSCCQIVKNANQVYRVHCGIATKIYDSGNF